jgi:hypothetical protein
VRFSAKKPSPAGGLRLPAGKHTSILIDFQTIVKEKMKIFNQEFQPSEITLRYLTGQAGHADFMDSVFGGKGGFV